MEIPPAALRPTTQTGPNLRQGGGNLLPQEAALMQKAKALEASFLSEMLGHAGLGAVPEGFGGGIGEDQFASFLRAEQAKAMVAKGGIGLAQQIFESLQNRGMNNE